jgi:hypothetical protein
VRDRAAMSADVRKFTPKPLKRSLEEEEREMLDRLRRLEESWPEFRGFVSAAITDVRDRIARIKKELDERQKH